MEWLHEFCHVVFSCAWRDSGLRCDVTKRMAVAASRRPSGVAACVVRLSFAAEHGKSM